MTRRGPETTASPWSSEESRAFLQERIGSYARLVFLISGGFYVSGWAIAAAFEPSALTYGLPLGATHHFHLASMAVLLLMWLSTRGAPLPGPVLTLIDGPGTFLAAETMVAMSFTIPDAQRPDLLAVVGLLGLLLYRAAIVPSAAKRTAWIGAVTAAPLPLATYYYFTHEGKTGTHPLWAYASYATLFGALAVLLSAATSRVIYGLRQTVREARRLGQYTLVEKIGEGGMGVVYRASHALLRRPTVIKLLPPERSGEIDLARFEREVQMTSLLTSPNTVSIYDYGRTPDGIFYYAMEYLDGLDLESLVRRDGPMPASRVVHVLGQVCNALEEAHRVGLIHRDVKPANILLCERGGTPDVAKVVDFGLVKSVQGGRDPGVTVENTVPGTPHYMAPEAISSPERIDARSDLYALGAVAYFLLTGHVVFEGGTMEVFGHHLHTAPVPPSERLGSPIAAGLEGLVLAALAKDPGLRPESARVFRESLRACDDVPPWSEREAAAWWRERGARLKRESPAPPPGTAAPRTLVVELGGNRG